MSNHADLSEYYYNSWCSDKLINASQMTNLTTDIQKHPDRFGYMSENGIKQGKHRMAIAR